MTIVTYKIATDYGLSDYYASGYVQPGELFAVRRLSSKEWRIDHLPTGAALRTYSTRRQAEAMARSIMSALVRGDELFAAYSDDIALASEALRPWLETAWRVG